MTDDLLGYDQLMQDALRGVVRAALQRAQGPRGLPGKHHFYITFKTRAPGVSIPDHLLQRYPDEMTIVLEHQYWDLEVYPDRFRVLLKFGGAPHPLVVPFTAMTRFFDPSVKFGLQFDGDAEAPRMAATQQAPAAQASGPQTQPERMEAPPQSAGVVNLDAFRKK